jgi:hypothetical protein
MRTPFCWTCFKEFMINNVPVGVQEDKVVLEIVEKTEE